MKHSRICRGEHETKTFVLPLFEQPYQCQVLYKNLFLLCATEANNVQLVVLTANYCVSLDFSTQAHGAAHPLHGRNHLMPFDNALLQRPSTFKSSTVTSINLAQFKSIIFANHKSSQNTLAQFTQHPLPSPASLQSTAIRRVESIVAYFRGSLRRNEFRFCKNHQAQDMLRHVRQRSEET